MNSSITSAAWYSISCLLLQSVFLNLRKFLQNCHVKEAPYMQFLQKWLYELARVIKRDPSSVVLQSLFLNFTSKATNIITLIFQFLLLRHRLLSWQQNISRMTDISINLSLFFNILIFPQWNFFKLSYFVKMILTNILQGKKYGVIQTDSLISRDSYFNH